MRLVRFGHRDGRVDWGAIDGDSVHSLEAVAPDMLDALGAALPQGPSGTRYALGEVQLLPPIVPPRNVFCLGRNYAEHIREGPGAQQDLPAAPIWFTKTTTSIIGPDQDAIVDPALTAQLDWEVELAVVIGRGGRRIPEEQALDYVFGYTVLNDLSARDLQFGRGGQWFLGKSMDGLCPIGPWIVTAGDIPDPQRLTLRLRVNGHERQHGTTADMIFPVARAIADLSRAVTLLPGDVIATGTPSGVGMGMKPPVYLEDGDVVEAQIDEIGVLRTRIAFRTGA